MNLPGKGGATHFEPRISPLASVRPPTELCVACSSEIRKKSSSHAMPKTPPLFTFHTNHYPRIPLDGWYDRLIMVSALFYNTHLSFLVKLG